MPVITLTGHYGGWLDQECGEGGQPLVLVNPLIHLYGMRKVPKYVGMRNSAAACFEMTDRNVKWLAYNS